MKHQLILLPFILSALCIFAQCRVKPDGRDAKLPTVEEAEKIVNAKFGAGAMIVYHHLDTERLPGLEEWIFFAPVFDLRNRAISGSFLKIADTAALHAMLSSRLPSLHLKSATYSERGEWESSFGKIIECDVLYADGSRIVYVVKQP